MLNQVRRQREAAALSIQQSLRLTIPFLLSSASAHNNTQRRHNRHDTVDEVDALAELLFDWESWYPMNDANVQ